MEKKIRKGDGGVYMVVVDETPEFELALRYAARMAYNRRGHVALLQIIDVEEFQDWGNVEAMLRKELREKAEQSIWEAARKVYDLTGQLSVLYIGEGEARQAVLETINSDDSLVQLVLGGGTGAKGPGALINYLIMKGLGELRIPAVIVPGNLDTTRIDAIT